MSRLAVPASCVLGALFATLPMGALAEIQMIQISAASFFKTSTAQASALPASSKCAVSVGQAFETSTPTVESGHLKVTLKKPLPGCSFSTGYFYEDHVTKSNTALTAHATTWFKRSAADSSTLPASDKCTMADGVYRLSGTVSDTGSHYKVNLASFLPGCGFSQGYVFEEHAVPGIQAVTLYDSAWLKTSTADSSTLPASGKCLVNAGNYTLAAPADAEGTHYQFTLARTPSGCAFRSGYIFHANTSLADPATASSAGYTFPLPGGVLGSGWCVCRSVGTSPHIGQDTYTSSGGMRAVAIADGVIDDRFFDAACGNFLVLKDNSGALWRYVHLNTPSVAIGNRVTRGQQLATISTYPTSSCGTGPHLHWERRSAGAFGDSATGKDCGQGYRSCNYDPVKPFRSAKQAGLSSPVPLTDAAPTDTGPTDSVLPERLCVSDPDAYPVSRNDDGPALPAADGQIRVAFAPEARMGTTVLTASAAFATNPANTCDRAAGRNCLVSWTLLAQTTDGQWHRVFHDAAVRNFPLARVADEAWCAPTGASGRYRLLFTDLAGQRYRHDVAP